MSNKELILLQLDEMEKYRTQMLHHATSNRLLGIEGFHRGWLDAIEKFRLMFEGVDVTVGIEVEEEVWNSLELDFLKQQYRAHKNRIE